MVCTTKEDIALKFVVDKQEDVCLNCAIQADHWDPSHCSHLWRLSRRIGIVRRGAGLLAHTVNRTVCFSACCASCSSSDLCIGTNTLGSATSIECPILLQEQLGCFYPLDELVHHLTCFFGVTPIGNGDGLVHVNAQMSFVSHDCCRNTSRCQAL